MEGAGLVTRTRNPDDERQVLLNLTDKGWALRDKAGTISSCIEEAVGLDAAAVSKVQAAVDAIRDNIHKRS
jgi:DNA-binding MarR family transcriptional regulator